MQLVAAVKVDLKKLPASAVTLEKNPVGVEYYRINTAIMIQLQVIYGEEVCGSAVVEYL